MNIDKIVDKLIRYFLTSYLSNTFLSKNKTNVFSNTYSAFINFIDYELNTPFAFITLRNFDCDIPQMKFSNNLILRLRTIKEFEAISDTKNTILMPKIPPQIQGIKYIVGANIDKSRLNQEHIKSNLEKFLFALQLFHEGDVQFGGIYYSDSRNWDVHPIIVLRPEPMFDIPTNKYRLEHNTLSNKDFKRFFNNIVEINFSKGKYTFLGQAIRKFSQAVENDDKQDRILDFMTCLESLYLSNEQQISFRLALRIAIILGKTTKQKLAIHEFILKMYNLRSKIIHGDKIPKIMINEKTIDMQSYLHHMEDIARSSIRIFMVLIKDFDTKEKLQKSIDDAIFDVKLQKKFTRLHHKTNAVRIDITNSSQNSEIH